MNSTTSIRTLLLYVDGMSERACQRFGHAFIKEIDEFCTLNKLKTDVPPNDLTRSSQQDSNKQVEKFGNMLRIFANSE